MLFDILFPESHSIIYPAFGKGPGAQTEAVGKAAVGVEFGGDASARHRLQAALHGAPGGDSVGGAAIGVGGRVAARPVGVTGVLHDDGPWLRNAVTGGITAGHFPPAEGPADGFHGDSRPLQFLFCLLFQPLRSAVPGRNALGLQGVKVF